MAEAFANSSAVSDLGLHCLPITLLGVSRLQWVNICCVYSFRSYFVVHFGLF